MVIDAREVVEDYLEGLPKKYTRADKSKVSIYQAQEKIINNASFCSLKLYVSWIVAQITPSLCYRARSIVGALVQETYL